LKLTVILIVGRLRERRWGQPSGTGAPEAL
jgi:hypothetical protein